MYLKAREYCWMFSQSWKIKTFASGSLEAGEQVENTWQLDAMQWQNQPT